MTEPCTDLHAALIDLCRQYHLAVLYVLRRAGDLAPFERARMALILEEDR